MYDQQFAVIGIILVTLWILIAALVVGLKDVIVFRKNTDYAIAQQKESMKQMFDEDEFDDAMRNVPDMHPTPTF